MSWTNSQLERLSNLQVQIQNLHSEIQRADPNAPGLDELVAANEDLAIAQRHAEVANHEHTREAREFVDALGEWCER